MARDCAVLKFFKALHAGPRLSVTLRPINAPDRRYNPMFRDGDACVLVGIVSCGQVDSSMIRASKLTQLSQSHVR